MPVLIDPAEFGISLQKWWCDIQPAFRKSNSGMPAAVFMNPTPSNNTDDWKELRKGGPNGLIVLITMLLWWGQGLERQTQWQDDSGLDWKATVIDVSLCLRSIGASVSNAKKQKGDNSSKETAKRWVLLHHIIPPLILHVLQGPNINGPQPCS
jgi:hypothetical protein